MLLIYIEDEREKKKETKTVVYCFYRKTGGKKGISRPFSPPLIQYLSLYPYRMDPTFKLPSSAAKNRRRSFKSRDVM